MAKFKVSVEKRLYTTGVYEIEAKNDAAVTKVNEGILHGKIQTTDIQWGDPQYEDSTFQPTGDVE